VRKLNEEVMELDEVLYSLEKEMEVRPLLNKNTPPWGTRFSPR
jgi:hypothetical protein